MSLPLVSSQAAAEPGRIKASGSLDVLALTLWFMYTPVINLAKCVGLLTRARRVHVIEVAPLE